MKPEAKVPELRFGTVLDDLLSLIFDACSRLAGVIQGLCGLYRG